MNTEITATSHAVSLITVDGANGAHFAADKNGSLVMNIRNKSALFALLFVPAVSFAGDVQSEMIEGLLKPYKSWIADDGQNPAAAVTGVRSRGVAVQDGMISNLLTPRRYSVAEAGVSTKTQLAQTEGYQEHSFSRLGYAQEKFINRLLDPRVATKKL